MTSGSDQNMMSARKRGGLQRKAAVMASRSTVGPIRGPDGVGVRWRESLCSELGTRRDGSRPDHEHQQVGVEQQRVRRSQGLATPTLQLDDEKIIVAQRRSKLVRRLVSGGACKNMKVKVRHNLAVIETPHGRRVILPPELWDVVFKGCHDSVWTFASASYTVEDCKRILVAHEVRRWVASCQECGSRKARPKEVIPPLRSVRGGDVGDRWALDVACPLRVTGGKQRYVIAAVEYVTRYAVASCVEHHNAENVAAFMMKFVVLRFGPFREVLTDGAHELTGRAIERLVEILQAHQTNPVMYRPLMIGTWKECVATYMQTEAQNDWDEWVDFALYSYNSGRHTTVSLSPNELMLGRKLRTPNTSSVTDAQRRLENVNSSDSGAIMIEECEVPGSSESESKLDVQTTKGCQGVKIGVLRTSCKNWKVKIRDERRVMYRQQERLRDKRRRLCLLELAQQIRSEKERQRRVRTENGRSG
ncbi:Enzymatic Polyprotein [Phytophthora megakarya]|uniref:Enzymatic Polyprotein n=1 Tax=Phytophthora megakarya TaxID=4795 RepID=A0A225VKF6_9STRA|nr:Enzymatic Polyprotein [Phytophthora megakarya]